mmetsp:Transcript_23837/g.75034  ORF Transcript_23837/g.75034 Transcript_23837/m.75034 type:complete len:653 (-) Transcript_23837:192-2150(-)
MMARALLLLALGVLLGAPEAAQIPVGESEHNVTAPDGRTRHFTVYVPDPSARRAEAAALYGLVLFYHGLNEDAEIMLGEGEGRAMADWYNFVAVSMHGAATTPMPVSAWNVGSCCAGNEDSASATDDVGFTEEVLTYVKNEVTVDASKVFAMGFSNGAWMVYRLACEVPELFTGFATAANGPDEDQMGDVFTACENRVVDDPDIDPPPPMWQVIGDADGQYTDANGATMPERWERHARNVMQCSVGGGAQPYSVDGPAGVGDDVTCTTFTNCGAPTIGDEAEVVTSSGGIDDRSSTVLCVYSGMDHVYPSSETTPYHLGVTEAAWRYLTGETSAWRNTIPLGTSDHSLTHDGLTRTFEVYVPESAVDAAPGLVLFYHGLMESADIMLDDHKATDVADFYNFVAVSLQGAVTTHRAPVPAWNVGGCCAGNEDAGFETDDVGFTEAVLDYVRDANITFDASKTFAMGFSNGAWMVYRLACEVPGLFAGFATAANGPDMTQQGDVFAACEALTDPPPPMWQVIGDADAQYTADGEDMPARWERHAENVMQCNVAGGARQLSFDGPDFLATDVTCSTFTECEGSNTVLCVYAGMEHEYPIYDEEPYLLGVTEAAWRHFTGEGGFWMQEAEISAAAAPTPGYGLGLAALVALLLTTI